MATVRVPYATGLNGATACGPAIATAGSRRTGAVIEERAVVDGTPVRLEL